MSLSIGPATELSLRYRRARPSLKRDTDRATHGEAGRHACTWRRGPEPEPDRGLCVSAVHGHFPRHPSAIVPVGDATFPVLTSDPSAGVPAENATQSETTGAFSADVLTPKRIQASFFWSREDAARMAGMGDALRSALQGGISDKLDSEIIQAPTASWPVPTLPTTHSRRPAPTPTMWRSCCMHG